MRPKKELIRIRGMIEFAEQGQTPNTVDIKFMVLVLEDKKKILVYPSSMHEVINGKFYSPAFIKAHEDFDAGKIIECELETVELGGIKMSYESLLAQALKNTTPRG